MSNDRKRILSQRTRTPGKALSKDDLASVTGGAGGGGGVPVPGCCVQGCDPCAVPGVGPLPTLPKWP